MTVVPTTASLATAPTWDGERRVAGGALAADPPALEGKDELTFGDFLSIINPLQHIPVVSTLYRWITGDTIKPAARVVGGALYGGPIGLVGAAFNAIVEETKGKDIGAQLVSLFSPDKSVDPATSVAAAAPEGKAAPAPADSNAAALQQLAADLRAQAAATPDANPTAPAVATPSQPSQARTLGFYQANAGQRLATVDSGRNGPPPKFNLAMFQTGPASPLSKPLPLPVAEEKSGQADPIVPQQGTPDAWFASAMLRGLDRYRASQQLNKAPPQLDVMQ
jgi:hypothetical protein